MLLFVNECVNVHAWYPVMSWHPSIPASHPGYSKLVPSVPGLLPLNKVPYDLDVLLYSALTVKIFQIHYTIKDILFYAIWNAFYNPGREKQKRLLLRVYCRNEREGKRQREGWREGWLMHAGMSIRIPDSRCLHGNTGEQRGYMRARGREDTPCHTTTHLWANTLSWTFTKNNRNGSCNKQWGCLSRMNKTCNWVAV